MNGHLFHKLATWQLLALGLLPSQACSSSKTNTASAQDAGNSDGGVTHHDGGLVSNVPCTNNGECTGLGMICDTFIDVCVQCIGSNCGTSTSKDGGVCATSGGNPCSSIPHLIGIQTLDGKGDEFCSIPPMQLDSGNAAKVIKYNATPPESASARIAWSNLGLHAFIEVQDASVQVVYTVDATEAIAQAYQGDSIELLFSSSNDVTGLTGTDANTQHVIVPASGPAVSTKASNVNGSTQGTPLALASNEYMQTSTGTGYAIELQLPWAGQAPTAGSNIRFDLALNSADSTFGGIADMRDGQLIYHLETVAVSTCQGTADGTVPYCDDRTWCTTVVTQ